MKIISRKEAIAQNLKYYFTGKPCKRGGIANRVVRNSDCMCDKCIDAIKEIKKKSQLKNNPPKGRFIHPTEESRKAALKESRRIWQEKNKDKVKVYKLRWEQKNKEKDAEGRARRNKRWGEKNKERKAVNLKKWQALQKAQVNFHTQNRRARRVQSTPGWFSELDEFILVECSELCILRKNATLFGWSVDHMVPLQAKNVCGLHVWNNFQVIPSKMNSSKRNKLMFMEPFEWLVSAKKYFQITQL